MYMCTCVCVSVLLECFLTDHLGVVGAADPARDELQRLPLDRAHAPDQRLLSNHLAYGHSTQEGLHNSQNTTTTTTACTNSLCSMTRTC